MKTSKTVLLVAATATLTACATYTPEFAIDPVASVNRGADYDKDYAECVTLANETVTENAGESAATSGLVGAATGAGLGALLSLVSGGSSGSAIALGAVAGGVAGAAEGATEPGEVRAQVIERCLTGRGYAVLAETE